MPARPAYDSSASLHDYQLLKCFAKGGFSQIWYARSREDGTACAVKVISKSQHSGQPDPEEAIRREIQNLRLLKRRSPFITQIISAFSNDLYAFIVSEYVCGGDLYDYLWENGPLGEKQARLYVAELACGLDDLHRRNIIFRDLKPENALIAADGHLKITDLGLSKCIRRSTRTFCGTFQTMAPEIFKRHPDGYGFEVDWYSLGICLYEMVLSKTPFMHHMPDREAFQKAVMNDKISLKRSLFQRWISKNCCSIIRLLLEKEPSKRLTGLTQVMSHPWLAGLSLEKVKAKAYIPRYIPGKKSGLQLSSYGWDHVSPSANCFYFPGPE